VGSSAGTGIVVNTITGKSYCTIQAAIDDPLTVNGHTITAGSGTYNEDVVVNKQVTILGAGYATTTVSGPIGGGGSTFSIQAPGVIIDGFTVTRDGNNVAQWNLALNSVGISIQSIPNSAEVRNCYIMGNRNGIDINNSNGNNIHNNIIDNNRTGLIFRNQTDNTNVQENFITNNWTAGVLFLDASGGTNSPVQTAINSTFNNNSISGNWYGEVVDRQTGGSLPVPGANGKNFECNWYGAASAPVTSSANSSEPGYAAQIPVIFGGTAVPPGGQPDILGAASANIDFVSWLTNGTDNAPATIGFQPVPGSCSGTPVVIASVVADPITCGKTTGSLLVTFSGGTGPYDISWSGTATGSATGITSPYTIPSLLAGPYTVTVTDANGSPAVNNTSVPYLPVYNTSTGQYYSSIQASIDAPATVNGNVISVCAGTYAENVVVSKSVTLNGPNTATNGCSTRVAEAVVRPATSAISSGEIFHVAASNVTISGFTIDGDNTSLTTGYLGTNGADLDAAEGVTVCETAINNLTVTNNIIRNLSYFGVTLYDYPAGLPSSGHTIANNKFEYLGTYDAGSGIDRWGGGVLLYNNQYAAVTNNCMDNVRLGVQTGNFYLANPGAATYQEISGNTITNLRRTGIFHNLAYSAASPFTVSNNTISGVSNVNESKWDGVLLASLSVPSTTSGNIISATGLSQPSTGIEVWNVKNTTPAIITGGTVTDVTNGIFLNNYDGFSSNGGDGAHATVSNITITPSASGNGIRLLDNTLSTHANVQASIGAGVIVTNGANGLVVENVSASVTALGNVAFSGQSDDYIKLINNANNINATTATFNGQTGASATNPQNFAIEDKITHKIDGKPLGFVTVKASNAFVTDIAPVTPTATNNDYTRIRNAVEHVSNNWTINHSGTFDWTETNAATSWANGNDGISGTTADNYQLIVPANLNGVTFTAPDGLGTATIQGPGDLAGVNLEGVLVFDGGDNQNWTISNMRFYDFDLPIYMGNGAGGTDAFNNTTITNNAFRLPKDLNAIAAPADVSQNIGIHFSFGTNQTISNNTFEVDGTGAGNGSSNSATIVMQSNTSGGTVYDGLKIKDNTITVTGVPDAVTPAVIKGIWENGHNTGAAIEISGNIFTNANPGNTADLNRQTAFWLTSSSDASKKVEYKNNEVSNYRDGIAWLGGLYTSNTPPDYNTGETPVEIMNNKFDKMLYGVVVRKSGGSTNAGSPAIINYNSFTNTLPAGFAISNEASGITAATCNWYGTIVPAAVLALTNGQVYYSPWLGIGTDIDVAVGFQPVPGSCTEVCTVTIAHAPGSPVNASCFGQNNGSIDVTVTDGSGTYGYAWTGSNPNPYTNNTQDITGLFAGTYNLAVTDLVRGCAATFPTVTITHPSPLSGTITGTATVIQSFMATSPITFTGTGGTLPYTFTYKINGVTQPTITTTNPNTSVTVQQSQLVLGAFEYELVSMTDANSCVGSVPMDPANKATVTVQTTIPRPDLYSQVTIVPNNSQFINGQMKEGYVTIENASVSPTTGAITFRVSNVAGFNLQIPPTATMSGGTPVDNLNWTITPGAFFYTVTSNPGVVIGSAPASKKIGFQLTATGTAGNSGVMTVTILNGTGGSSPLNGDSNNGNNASVKLFSIN
jgi:Right handed beta helix region/SprB repeat